MPAKILGVANMTITPTGPTASLGGSRPQAAPVIVYPSPRAALGAFASDALAPTSQTIGLMKGLKLSEMNEGTGKVSGHQTCSLPDCKGNVSDDDLDKGP